MRSWCVKKISNILDAEFAEPKASIVAKHQLRDALIDEDDSRPKELIAADADVMKQR